MAKTLDDLIWELEYADKFDRKHDKKNVKVDDFLGASILEDCLRNGLNALEDHDLSDDEKLVKVSACRQSPFHSWRRAFCFYFLSIKKKTENLYAFSLLIFSCSGRRK